ncbi:Uncharacterised protein [Klebsiella pneumoniae]|uniref:Uncharacterized protein n=1 Tax=Klebsiella pneumoniae TaxID=573 RepID=A0A378C7A1_KLEPN|nr:Uncharacterised protein [Klebsiella pneumoniae]
MYQNVLNSVNNAAIHPWDYSWFVSIMPKNNTFTHQIFHRNSHFFTPLVIIFNAKHFLTENVVTVALPLSK